MSKNRGCNRTVKGSAEHSLLSQWKSQFFHWLAAWIWPCHLNTVVSISLPVGINSVQFSHSVVSDSLGPHELQHTRPPCPSPTPRVYSNLSIELVMPPSHLILIPFSSCPQSLQHQSLFQSVNSLHEVAKALELQHKSLQWTPRTDL